MRFRPSLPFTEPSAEVDIRHIDQHGRPKGIGWKYWVAAWCTNVLRNVNIDPDEYSGFAFGVGLDRLAMMRYGIPDLRMMFEVTFDF